MIEKLQFFLSLFVPDERNGINMNNNDISYLMNMLNKMDQTQLANGLNQINQMLTPEEKQKIIQALNSKKN